MNPWELLLSITRKFLKQEILLLIPIFIFSVGAWAFIEIADEVTEGESHAIDEQILLALREPGTPQEPWGPEWIAELARDFTALGGIGVLTFLTLFSVGYLYLRGERNIAAFLLLSILGGLLVSSLLKYGFDRPRPDLVPHGSYVYTASFPSGHSMMAAIVYLTLGVILARSEPKRSIKIWIITSCLFLTLAVGLSRVYLAVHWPTDVLAGWSSGAAFASLCWFTTHYLQRRSRP
ncbi:MAG: phosphatase PAP2 family protein [Akkermansiaceae bacterium]